MKIVIQLAMMSAGPLSTSPSGGGPGPTILELMNDMIGFRTDTFGYFHLCLWSGLSGSGNFGPKV